MRVRTRPLEMLGQVLDQVPLAFFLKDENLRYLLINQAAARYLGRAAEEALGKGDEEWVEANTARARRGHELRVLATGVTAHFEETIAAPGGARSYHTTCVARRGFGGQITGAFGFAREVTEQRASEHSGPGGEQRYRTLFERVGVGITIVAPDGTYLDVNGAFARLNGYSREEMVGRKVTDFVVTADLPLIRERIARAGGGETLDYERRAVRRDGTAIWVKIAASLIPESDTEPAQLVALVLDIDDRKRAEEALQLLSGKLLQLQDEERRRIAHSLHESAAQTLAALSMHLHQLERAALSPAAARTLEESLSLTEQCTREIRTLSHLLHPPLLDDAGLLPALRWYVDGFSQRSNIPVEITAPPDLGRLPRELELAIFRVVQESLTNIHHHSESRTATIRLEQARGSLTLEIADRGRGLPRRMLGPPGGPLEASGGVGISSMRDRVSQLGGHFSLASQVGGTLVSAVFPLSAEQ